MEETQRTNRKQLVGRVVAQSGDKTISVIVETHKKHPLYGKRVKHSKKFAAHDELNTAQVGDVVKIEGTRPLSKNKQHRLVEVLEKAIIL